MNTEDKLFYRVLRTGGLRKEVTEALMARFAKPVTLVSPNGHVWRASIANDGTVTWTDTNA